MALLTHDEGNRRVERKTPTPYPELNSVLQTLVKAVAGILGGNFVGSYLQGSFAIGDFDQHSDVDFIIVIEGELSVNQLTALQEMHERIYCLVSRWAKHLEGSYFPKGILRDLGQRDQKLWYLDNGARSLIESTHCNTLVVRWTLREYGVTLAGPPPATLIDPIPVDMLREEILKVMVEWGADILANPERYSNHFYQTFIVLTYCRMLHDLQNGYPGSKRAGAEWAKANLDPTWIDLIDRTWAGRPNPAVSVRRLADPEDYQRTLQFIRYVIEESQKIVINLV